MSVLCRIFGHRRRRKSAWFDNVSWRAPCVRCAAPLARNEAGKWRAMTMEELRNDSRTVRKGKRGRPAQAED